MNYQHSPENRKMMRSNNAARLILKLLTIFMLVLGVSPMAHAERMSLRQCMRLAIENDDSLKAAGYEIEARAAERKSIRGRFLPVVQAEANVLVWDKEQNIAFDMGALGNALDEMLADPIVQSMLSAETLGELSTMDPSDSAIKVRDKVTYGATLTLAQPLTGIYKVYSGYWAKKQLEESAKYDKLAKRRGLLVAVGKSYHGLITARKLIKTVKAGIEQVKAIETQVQAFLDAGLVEKNALYKVQVSLAELQRNAFMAEKGAKLALASLNRAMGRAFDSPIDPVVGDIERVKRNTGEPLRRQQNRALEKRPELLSAKAAEEAAKAGKHAAIAAMLPDINAIFTYQYQKGMGSMQPENQYFGGLVLSWNPWEWGATYFEIDRAKARERQAAAMIRDAESGIQLQVKKARLDLEEAIQSLEVAQVQVKQARENLRIEKARYEAQQTTTTDLLGAQTKALQAESEMIAAKMRIRQAALELKMSMGDTLLDAKEAIR